MDITKQPGQRRAALIINWPTVLSLLTALVASGTVTLHFIGAVSHRNYLRYWGIDADLFPKTTDWVLINGYYAIVHRFIASLSAILGNLHWYLAAAAVLCIYVVALLWPTGNKSGEMPAWMALQSEWKRRVARQSLITLLFVGAMPCALLLVTAFVVVPALLGETAGAATAEKEALEFKKGCQASKLACVELRADQKLVATGFVLDISSSRIAIFDTQLSRSRVLALEKLDLTGVREPGPR